MSACNPACGAGELCVIRAGAPICATLITPDGSTDDIVDATTPSDGPQPPTDVTAPSDVPVTPTDVSPVDGGRPPCGMTGQPCCLNACVGNNVCNSTTMRCEAFTPEADECTSTAMCAAGRVCTYSSLCSGGTRVCLKCQAPQGALTAGTQCGSMTGLCATGVCANSACTVTCAPGEAGNTACRAFDPLTICSELGPVFQNLDGGRGPVSAFGACLRTCRRDADCPSFARCGLAQQRVSDSFVQTCSVPRAMLTAGAVCPITPTSFSDQSQLCQSGQCFGATSTATMGNCSAFCATDADCPTALPRCREIPFTRPSETGTSIPIRMCDR